jgi:hypothetical protein
MGNNRIGDPCWYLFNGLARRGKLRMWGQEGSLEEGIAPIAVVEDDTTRCPISIHVSNVCFATIPPWPRERGGGTA